MFLLSPLSYSSEPPSGTLSFGQSLYTCIYMEVFLSVINFVEFNHDIYLIEVLLYRLIRYWLHAPVCYHNLKINILIKRVVFLVLFFSRKRGGWSTNYLSDLP